MRAWTHARDCLCVRRAIDNGYMWADFGAFIGACCDADLDSTADERVWHPDIINLTDGFRADASLVPSPARCVCSLAPFPVTCCDDVIPSRRRRYRRIRPGRPRRTGNGELDSSSSFGITAVQLRFLTPDRAAQTSTRQPVWEFHCAPFAVAGKAHVCGQPGARR